MDHIADSVVSFFREHWQLFATVSGLIIGLISLYFKWYQHRDTRKQKKLEEPGFQKSRDADPEIEKYSAKAETLHANLPIAGFSTKLRVPIDVEDIYVPLRAMVHLKGVNEEIYADAKDAEHCFEQGRDCMELSLPDAFKECEKRNRRGIVILGDPGAGKTTHLKRVLLACCRKGPKSLGLPNGMVPVFLTLRDMKDQTGSCASFIQSQLDANAELDTAPDFGKRLMARENLLLLLDGLDEVSREEDRILVSRWIENLLQSHPSCKVVVTCRFAGYGKEVRLDHHFLELHIRPLSEDESAKFVRNWYRIVETGLSVDRKQAEATAKKNADDLVNRLKEPEFRARRVSELTANPLLLTNLCLVHRDRGELPKRRSQLYSECVDVLLERWRKGKKLDTSITADMGRRVLQPAALWLHGEEGRTRATADALGPIIEPVLKDVKWQNGGALEFLKTVRDESGLLTGWGDSTYGFMHLGFQEYLAAWEIRRRALNRDETVLSELASHFGESWWQEVSLLLLAVGNPSQFEPFMREVTKHPSFVSQSALVEACLDEAVEISDKPFIELLEQDPGRSDTDLWSRQLAALRILERRDKETFERIGRDLKGHPSEEIRQWMKSRNLAAKIEAVIHEKSGIELVRIPAGTFMMGAPEGEADSQDNERPYHKQSVVEFYMGRYPVTNEAYARFLKSNPEMKPPAYWNDRQYNRPEQPLMGVSWYDAQAFCKWTDLGLPSEVEWEYACRAGTTTRFHSGDDESDLDRVGWYGKNSDNSLHPVGQKEPNGFGLYDMHGNVWEWTRSKYKGYPYDPKDGREDLENVSDNERRVLRGGAFSVGSGLARSAFRVRRYPDLWNWYIGFRVAASPFRL